MTTHRCELKQILIALMMLISTPVYAQEHTHEGDVGKFYQEWMQPGPRATSCCNNLDCAVVTQVRPLSNGNWEFLRTLDNTWVEVPKEKLEHNQGDPIDSPDGYAHLCSRGTSVYCAVLGSGQ